MAVLGSVEAASGRLFAFNFPFQPANMKHIRDAMSTSFLLALLGFFESTIAAKSLGASASFPGMQFSANRELVALGVSNVVGGCFMSLPAFGGYGKSKVKVATGGKSPMSNVFLSLITLSTILYVLPYMYFLPVSDRFFVLYLHPAMVSSFILTMFFPPSRNPRCLP